MAGDGGTTPEGALATRDSSVRAQVVEKPSFTNPIQEIKAYAGMGRGFYLFDEAGIGAITVQTIFKNKDRSKPNRELLHPVVFRTEMRADSYHPAEIKGVLGWDLVKRVPDSTSKLGYKLDEDSPRLIEADEYSEDTIGIPGIDYAKVQNNLEKQLEQDAPGAKVMEAQEKSPVIVESGGAQLDRYAVGTTFLQVDYNGNTIRIYPTGRYNEKEQNIVNPNIRMFLTDDIPLEEQYKNYQQVGSSFLKSLSLSNPQISFQADQDNVSYFMNTFRDDLERLRNGTPTDQLQSYLKQSMRFGAIEKSEGERYEDAYGRLEIERKKFFENAEQPDITQQPFPYVATADYDMNCEPYLHPDQSERFTKGLVRALEDLGLNDTNERVVKRMYANITEALHSDGSVTYELLTPSPKLLSPHNPDFSTSVGSTHNDIYDTQDIRKQRGANYLPYPEELTIKGGARGIIIETASGKKYAIWEHEVHVYEGGAEGFTEESGEKAHVLDSKLATDLEERYGIRILGGNLARDLLNKTVWKEFTTSARKPLIETVERKYGPAGEQLSITERLRKLTQLQSGFNAFEDKEKDD